MWSVGLYMNGESSTSANRRLKVEVVHVETLQHIEELGCNRRRISIRDHREKNLSLTKDSRTEILTNMIRIYTCYTGKYM